MLSPGMINPLKDVRGWLAPREHACAERGEGAGGRARHVVGEVGEGHLGLHHPELCEVPARAAQRRRREARRRSGARGECGLCGHPGGRLVTSSIALHFPMLGDRAGGDLVVWEASARNVGPKV